MIDISFLNKPNKLKSLSGSEFLDWQNTTCYDDLVSAIKDSYEESTGKLILNKADRDAIELIIKRHTNITLRVVAKEDGNLSIDSGFITPNSVLNNRGVDLFVSKKYSKTSEAFKYLKTNILKGYCDLKTGRVEGDYKDFEFNLNINVHLKSYLDIKAFKKNGVTVPEGIAGAILHECGHVFFSLYYVTSTVIDNAMMLHTVRELVDEPEISRRSIIIKDVNKAIGVDIPEEAIKEPINKEEAIILFEKGLNNRDYRRTLSLGVTKMTNEVLADAYSIRMGGSRGLVGLLDSIGSENAPSIWEYVVWVVYGCIVFLTPFGGIRSIFMYMRLTIQIMVMLDNTYVPGIYDTPYRRLKAILRENIARLESLKKTSSNKEYDRLIIESKKLEITIEKNKGFFESTGLQRVMGYINAGSDFRKTEFEHYTAELTNSALTLHVNI